MCDGHPFGHSGGARRVDDVGDVGGCRCRQVRVWEVATQGHRRRPRTGRTRPAARRNSAVVIAATGAASASMNSTRAAGNAGSIGRYAAPVFSTAAIATIASAHRENSSATHEPGPTPRSASKCANRFDASRTRDTSSTSRRNSPQPHPAYALPGRPAASESTPQQTQARSVPPGYPTHPAGDVTSRPADPPMTATPPDRPPSPPVTLSQPFRERRQRIPRRRGRCGNSTEDTEFVAGRSLQHERVVGALAGGDPADDQVSSMTMLASMG